MAMSSSKSQLNLPPQEVRRSDCVAGRGESAVNKADHDADSPLDAGKKAVGGAVKFAMGQRAMKEFGDTGQMSNVCSGEKVPEYLARIWNDREARRRFGMAFMRGGKVRVQTVMSWEDEEAS